MFREFVDSQYHLFPVKEVVFAGQGKTPVNIRCLRVKIANTTLAPISIYVHYIGHRQGGHYLGGKFSDRRKYLWAKEYFDSPLEEYEVEL